MQSHSPFVPRWLPLERLEARMVLSADLVIEGVTAPTEVRLGTEIEVSWVVRNAGDEATTAEYGWVDGLYLSTDDVLDASDLYLSESFAERVSPLAPGETQTRTASVWLPFDALLTAGQYRVIVAADVGEWEAESNEANNVTAHAVGVSVPLLPDLTVSEVNASTVAQFGDSFTISWTVTNTGPGSTFMEWVDGVYLSTDGVLDPSDQWLNVLEYAFPTTPLAPGESITMQVTAHLPFDATLAPGSYRLIISADDIGMQAEGDESNNARASAEVTIALPDPADLTIDSGSAPATGELGQTVEVTWVVRNQGAGLASTWGWADGVYLSLDGVLGEGDVQVGWSDAGWGGAFSLAAGQSQSGQATLWLPQDGSIQPGTYQIIVRADEYGQVFDADPTNNTLAIATIEITGEVVPPPEFNPGPWPEFGLPSLGAPSIGGFLQRSNADTPGTGAAEAVAPTTDQAQPGTSQTSDVSNLVGTSDLGTGLFTFTDRAGTQRAARGLSKINLRVASDTTTPVVRSSFVN